MRITTIPLFSVLSLFSLVYAADANNQDHPSVPKSTATVIPGRYIVEFDSAAHLASGVGRRSATPHEAIYNDLKARNIAFNLHFEYQSDLFIGCSMTLGSVNDLSSLASTEGVLNILPVHLLNVPDTPSGQASQWPASAPGQSTNASTSLNTTTSVSNGTIAANATVSSNVTVAAASKQSSSPAPSTSTTGFSNLPEIQADEVQATGNKGKGIKIGIIDGGVDYSLPALGGCFGNGCKIAGGYDFVGDNFNGSNDPMPDNDPFDNCYTHGTTVAGIIGANDNEYNVPGVAPEASLYVYRVFSCLSATTNDIVMQAMLQAYKDGVDIINLSLGEPNGWTSDPLEFVATRLVNKGLVVVASTGNNGQVGAFYSGSPGGGVGVISTGSTDAAIFPAHKAIVGNVSPPHDPITYYNFQPFTRSPKVPLTPNKPYPAVAYTTDPNVPTDGCTQGSIDLTGKVVLVRRGGCALEDKAKNAFLSGAVGILIVNYANTPPLYQMYPSINFGMISNEEGSYLLGQIAAGAAPTLSFSFAPVAVSNTFTGKTTSLFSSYGPTNDLFMSPQISTPGGYIINLWPNNPALGFYNWSISDGTSWSSSFASGAAALYLNAKGKTGNNPKRVREAFESTGSLVPVSVSDKSLNSVAAQGAGRLQIFDAINTGLVVSPTELLLNDTANLNGQQKITLTNNGRNSVTYTLAHVPAGTAIHFQSGKNETNDAPVPQVANAASVTFSQSSVTLSPGLSGSVIIEFTPPTGLDAQTFPIYSGFIQISGDQTVSQIPYLGVAAKMKDMPILDPAPVAFAYSLPVIQDANQQEQNDTKSYSFKGTDFPTVVYRQIGGTPLLLVDLVAVDASLGFTPNYNTRRDVSASRRSGDLVNRKRAASPQHRGLSLDLGLGLGAGGAGLGLGLSVNGSVGLGPTQLWCILANYNDPKCGKNTFNQVPILGNLYEVEFQPRDTDNADGAGLVTNSFALSAPTYSNGTTIPNGTYRFLLRTLKITGDYTKESDYEAWLSKPFVVAA